MNIPTFPGYQLVEGIVYKNGKAVTATFRGRGRYIYKMKHESGKWKQLALRTVKSLFEPLLNLPEGSREVKNTDGKYWIDVDGNVYSFTHMNLKGVVLQHYLSANGYVSVGINNVTREVHSIMANTFILDGYADKGLCCLHKDNDKTNPSLDNLSVGTYSENNKDAYKDGLNKGNKNGSNGK